MNLILIMYELLETMNAARFPYVAPKYLAVPLSYVRGSLLSVARYPLTLQR